MSRSFLLQCLFVAAVLFRVNESKYVLTCNAPYECDSNDLSAPSNEDVHLFCESDHSCQYATIDGSVSSMSLLYTRTLCQGTCHLFSL